jgi:hypothetical protein
LALQLFRELILLREGVIRVMKVLRGGFGVGAELVNFLGGGFRFTATVSGSVVCGDLPRRSLF